MTNTVNQAPDRKFVLAKATFNAAELLEINHSDLAAILGLDSLSLSSIEAKKEIDPNSKVGELAVNFIRVYRSVYVLSGGVKKNMKLFLTSNNHATGGVPLEQMKDPIGMLSVLQYVEAMSEKG